MGGEPSQGEIDNAHLSACAGLMVYEDAVRGEFCPARASRRGRTISTRGDWQIVSIVDAIDGNDTKDEEAKFPAWTCWANKTREGGFVAGADSYQRRTFVTGVSPVHSPREIILSPFYSQY